ncbi:GDSL-type esterase/lipase family protein [Larkinella terrae]|uniref:GDSL family lipase n=1 Tax=Larkinella terrae TaxID=2025311 RepID=A0A7K0EUW5_9BACT|nr:GDSL-type esterase/lipase family protein [Larkinella terrae]MRS65605.1 GDSL family lipase [Larkinella terrae]
MRKMKATASLGYLLLLLLFLPDRWAFAQQTTQPVADSPNAPFTLKNGDRVVFLGNSLFENDYQYGYLELALTTRFPDRDVTFRNLGWAGDNVYGVARSTITNPPTGYQLLMEHLTKTQPTVVFLAFGGIEAQDGEAGLPVFREGLLKLLDKIDQLGARAILLSPIPVLSSDTIAHKAQNNALLEVYSSAIAKIASERGKRFIDIYKPVQELSKTVALTENGIHLNENGYYYLATLLEKSLGLAPRAETVSVNVSKTGAEAATPAKMVNAGKDAATLIFTMDEKYLPLPQPAGLAEKTTNARVLKVTGLKKGFYKLTTENQEVVTASAKDWENGVLIQQGPSFNQVNEIRHMILKKNDLFFFQYRPPNTTYILGFRAYEQGRHVKGLEEQSFIIKWLESQVALNRAPRSSVYQLTLLK